jgi:hypothetical protein
MKDIIPNPEGVPPPSMQQYIRASQAAPRLKHDLIGNNSSSTRNQNPKIVPRYNEDLLKNAGSKAGSIAGASEILENKI